MPLSLLLCLLLKYTFSLCRKKELPKATLLCNSLVAFHAINKKSMNFRLELNNDTAH